jgi:hypothetical protein
MWLSQREVQVSHWEAHPKPLPKGLGLYLQCHEIVTYNLLSNYTYPFVKVTIIWFKSIIMALCQPGPNLTASNSAGQQSKYIKIQQLSLVTDKQAVGGRILLLRFFLLYIVLNSLHRQRLLQGQGKLCQTKCNVSCCRVACCDFTVCYYCAILQVQYFRK